MGKETLTLTISDSGEAMLDVDSGDGKCHGVTKELVGALKDAGVTVNVTNVQNRYPDDPGTKVKIKC